MGQMNKIGIGVDREDYFLQEIQEIQRILKFFYILATTRLGDNFAAVSCHFFYGRVHLTFSSC